jgi:Mg2+-importing ATPase
MIKIIFVVAPLVFIIKLLSSNDQQNSALIYTITVVIGLTPEILPIIISISLVKSGKKLLKKKVVVRNLSAVQNLGTINVLCFDKTGTLTSNKPVVKN